jgi:hypothetical protein
VWILTKDAVALKFYSVGTWDAGKYGSFFELFEYEQGADDLINPFVDAIHADLLDAKADNRPVVSILTLWSGKGYMDYWGEYDFDIDYHGRIDLTDLYKLVQQRNI